LIRATIVDRTPHQRMNGVARYMLGLASHPAPRSLGVDLRFLYWGRELPAWQWRKRFAPSNRPHPYATYCNRRFLRPLAQRWSRADVIHYPFHYLPNDWTIGAGAKIITVHGASAFSEALWEPARGEQIKRGLHQGINQLAQIITVSEWSKKELVEHFELPVEKIVVIPNGVRLDLFQPMPRKSQLRTWLATTFRIHTPYLLHVGPCEPRKNTLRLVQAFAKLIRHSSVPYTLVMAGANGQLTPAVEREIDHLGIRDAVITTGPVDDTTLIKLYNGADLFLFPSLYEGFGIPVLEAMACGTPVVISNTTALPEIGQDAAAYIDDPTSIENIATSIEAVLADGQRKTEMQTQGRRLVQRYSWQRQAIRHLQLYREVGECQ